MTRGPATTRMRAKCAMSAARVFVTTQCTEYQHGASDACTFDGAGLSCAYARRGKFDLQTQHCRSRKRENRPGSKRFLEVISGIPVITSRNAGVWYRADGGPVLLRFRWCCVHCMPALCRHCVQRLDLKEMLRTEICQAHHRQHSGAALFSRFTDVPGLSTSIIFKHDIRGPRARLQTGTARSLANGNCALVCKLIGSLR